MGSSVFFQLGMLVFGGLALILFLGDWNWEWRLGDVPGWFENVVEEGITATEGSAITILLVRDESGLRAMRNAIDPDRIVASAPGAFALAEGRIVATSIEAASGPLNTAGWADRPLEILQPPRRLGEGAPARPVADARGGGMNSLATLKDQKFLSHSQSMKLLNDMERRGDF